MKIRKLAACLFAVTSLASLTVNSALTSYALPSGQNTMRDMTTMEIVEDMGIGINLGNTFESCGDWISMVTGLLHHTKLHGEARPLLRI